MRILPPLTITDAMLTSTSIAEPAAGEVEWVSAGAYVLGDQRIRTTTHRIYECVQAHSGRVQLPEVDAAYWLDAGPTLRHAMFDNNRTTPSTGASPLVVTLTPGTRFNSAFLGGLVGDLARIHVTRGATDIYDQEVDLLTRNTVGWYSYYTGGFRQRSSVLKLDIPPHKDNVLTVTITRSSGDCAMAELMVGMAEFVGRLRRGAEDDVINFSKITRKAGGEAKLTPARNVPTNRLELYVENKYIDRVRQLRDDLNSKPAVYAGIESEDHPYFEAMLKVGLARRWTNGFPLPTEFLMNMEIEEL